MIQKFTGRLLEIKHTLLGINHVVREIRESQLQINHENSEILSEIKDRVKNSSTLVLSDTEMITKCFSGLKFSLDPRDIAVAPHLALDSIWEHDITSAWLKTINENDTVFDIGANFGYFGALAAQQTNKKSSKVVMFEANPDLIPYIQKTLNLNWLNEQTTIENYAVADKPGKVTLNVLEDYLGSSSLQGEDELKGYLGTKMKVNVAKKHVVKSVTIDDYCKQHAIDHIDLIKIDVEGLEDKVYTGMKRVVKQSSNLTLFIEFTPRAYKQPEAFWDRLCEDFPYTYMILSDGRTRLLKDRSYDRVVGEVSDWVMPIFSKKGDLYRGR